MQSRPENLYEYAVIRIVPKIEREEFFNVGLIMMCKRQRWIRFQFNLKDSLLTHFKCSIEREQIILQLDSMRSIAEGDSNYGAMAQLPVEERFRWLTAVKSACIQSSRPHPGLTCDLESTFSSQYSELVE